MDENGGPSPHRCQVYRAVRDAQRWVSNHEIAEACVGVNARTVRAHTKALVDLGVFEQAQLFPGHRFRLTEQARNRSDGYVQRLEDAAKIYGLEP